MACGMPSRDIAHARNGALDFIRDRGCAMTNRLTDDQVLALRDGCEGVTPGPWFPHDFADPAVSSDPTCRDIYVSCTTPDHISVASMHGGIEGHRNLKQGRSDASHIAGCDPDTIRALADEVIALRKARALISRAQAAKIAELEAALEPFRQAAIQLDDHNPSPLPDEATAPVGEMFTMTDFRATRRNG